MLLSYLIYDRSMTFSFQEKKEVLCCGDDKLFWGKLVGNLLVGKWIFSWPTAHEQCVHRSCGLMDKAPDFGSGDCRFESCHDRFIFSSYFFLYILKARFCDHTYVSNQIEMMKYIYVYHVSWCPMHRNCLWTSNANSIDSLASLSFLHTGRTIIQIWT